MAKKKKSKKTYVNKAEECGGSLPGTVWSSLVVDPEEAEVVVAMEARVSADSEMSAALKEILARPPGTRRDGGGEDLLRGVAMALLIAVRRMKAPPDAAITALEDALIVFGLAIDVGECGALHVRRFDGDKILSP